MTAPLLRVEGLRVELDSGAPIVEDVSLELRAGEVLGLVGESGSGKTTTALALLGFARPGARIGGGRGRGRRGAADGSRRGEQHVASRGRLVSYVAQDPGARAQPSAPRARAWSATWSRRTQRTQGAGAVAARARRRSPADRPRLRTPVSRTSSRAGSSSGSRSPPRSFASRGSSSSTSRRQGSTWSRRRASSRRSTASDASAESRSSTCRTTSPSSGRSPTASQSCTRAGSSRRAPRRRPCQAAPPLHAGLLGSVPDLGQPRRLESIPGVAVGVGERPGGCAFAPRCLQRTGDRALHEMPQLEDVGGGRRVRCFEWAQTPPLDPAGTRGALRHSSRSDRCSLVEALRAEHRGRLRLGRGRPTTCPSRLRPPSASPSSGSRGAARRRSRAASSVSMRPPQGASSSTARLSPSGLPAGRARHAAASRSSSRIPTTR